MGQILSASVSTTIDLINHQINILQPAITAISDGLRTCRVELEPTSWNFNYSEKGALIIEAFNPYQSLLIFEKKN